MGRITLAFVGILTFTFANVTAQKRVWNDDKEAVLKADTSLVKIRDLYYQKTVTVTYKEINQATFDERLEHLKNERAFLRSNFESNREQYLKQLEALDKQVEAERKFISETKKQMKWLDKDDRKAAGMEKTEAEIQNERREYFRVKPKKQ